MKSNTRLSTVMSLAIGLLTASLTPGMAQAAPQWASGSMAMLYPFGDGTYVVALDGASAPNCGSAGNGRRYFRMTTGQNGVVAEGLKNLVATALSAFAMGKPISVAYDDSSAYCFVAALTVE